MKDHTLGEIIGQIDFGNEKRFFERSSISLNFTVFVLNKNEIQSF